MSSAAPLAGVSGSYRPPLRARDVNAPAPTDDKENALALAALARCSLSSGAAADCFGSAAPACCDAATASARIAPGGDVAGLQAALEAARAEAADLRARLAGAAERGMGVARERSKLAERCARLEADAAAARASLEEAHAAAAAACASRDASAREAAGARADAARVEGALASVKKALAAALDGKRAAAAAAAERLAAATQRADALVRRPPATPPSLRVPFP
jgi:hypothetical protein